MRHLPGIAPWLLMAFAFAAACDRQGDVSRPFLAEKYALRQATVAADSLADNGELPASDSLLAIASVLADKIGRSHETYLFHRRRTFNFFEKKPQAAAASVRELADRFAVEDDSLSGFYCSLHGWAEARSGNYLAAIPALERAATIFEKHGPAAKLNGTYNNLGACYGQLGDHEKAISNYAAALRINLQKRDSTEISNNHFNLSKAYLNLGDLQKAESNARAAHAFLKMDDGSFEFQMAAIALAQHRPADALRLVDGLASSRPELLDHEKNAAAADNLLAFGEVALAAGYPDRALPFLEKSGALIAENTDSSSWETVKNRFLIGDCYLKKGRPEQALGWFDRAIGAVSGGGPHLLTADSLPPEVWAMEAMNGRALALTALFERQKHPADLVAAIENWKLAAGMIQKLDEHFVEDGSRLALGEQTFRAFFEKPIETALRLSDLTGDLKWRETAYWFSARSKAAVLRAALLEKKQLLSSGLSTGQLRRFFDLRMMAASLEQRAVTEPSDSIHAAFFRAKREIDIFKKNLKLPKNGPIDEMPDLPNSLRSALPDGSLLVEYFLGERFLYIFTLSKDGLDVEKKPLQAQFFGEAAAFRRSVSDWKWVADSAISAEKDYLRSASWLHGFLLKNSLEKYPATDRLFVVPDGELAQLPFAALLTRPFVGGWKETGLPVLVKKLAVSYLFSAHFLLEKKAPKTSAVRIGFGGFGADYRDRWTLAALKKTDSQPERNFLLAMRGGPDTLDFADDEVDSIAHLTGGEKWVNGRATKANFLENATHCAVLHTSLHTVEGPAHDPTGLAILFSKTSETEPNLLTSSELYALDLHADLTVVSTCRSGFGEVRRGEGAMTLGRAIAIAGCPATVVNLWNADDGASKELMIAFYKNLKSGQSKDVALQKAMLYYLERTVSEKATPLFWANFSAFGAMSPVAFSDEKPARHWWAVGLGLIFAILFLILQKRQKDVTR